MRVEALERFKQYLAEAAPSDPGIRLVCEGPLRFWLGQGQSPLENTALYTGTAEGLDAAIVRALAFFAAEGRGFEFKFTAWNMPQEAQARLQAQGFVPGECEQVLALAVPTAVLPAAREGLNLRELSAPEEFEQLSQLQETIWKQDFSWLGEGLWREQQAQPHKLLLYGIAESGRLVAAAWMRIEADIAFFHGGATSPAWRGKGLYRELVHARLRAAQTRKLRWAFTEAAPASLPILDKMGFEPIGETRPFFLYRSLHA